MAAETKLISMPTKNLLILVVTSATTRQVDGHPSLEVLVSLA